MRLPDSSNGRLILASVLCGLSMALSLVDFSVSALLSFMPGVKLGLANIVTLFALYALGLPYALMICAVRSAATALLSGSLSMLFFSLFGGIASIFVMFALKGRLRMVKVSVAGAVTHNMAQVFTAWVLTGTSGVVYYAPALILSGALSGFFTGALCSLIFWRLSGAARQSL